MDREHGIDQALGLLTDRVLEALRQRLEKEGSLDLQGLKQITGLIKDLRDLRTGREAQAVTVVFTGEAETLSE